MFRPASPPFLGLPHCDPEKLEPGDIAIFGVPEATPYEPGKPSHARAAPAAIRQAITKYSGWTGHHDFDFGDLLIPEGPHRIFDLGDMEGDPGAPDDNRARIASVVGRILDARAFPLILGGDDSVPIPVFTALESTGPIWVVQVDAHLDWRDERDGVREGWSSPMRRASEMPWVEGIVQAGIRGVGSARPGDVDAAREYGGAIFTAREIHCNGIRPIADAVPEGARCFLTLDCDALDPSVIPAVLSQAPGGLTYWHIVELIEHLAARTDLAGFDLVELAPEKDVNGLGALTAGRIVCNFIANLIRASRRQTR